ncbi:MAG: hypothetical protein CXT77_00610 [uncultured DHVE6 group euryarchaeote]|jgi:hypothetical protein|nr:MAG: hypothetical protein CXT77_00610 [uncultured DHVE6 group euryarchaeote]
MIGPKEWSEMKGNLIELNPFLRVKKLKESILQTADKGIKKEIKDLLLKAESESINSFSRSDSVPKLPKNSLENLVNKKDDEVEKKGRTIEEIAKEDSTLTDSDIKKLDVNYDPNKESDKKLDVNYDPNKESDLYNAEGFYESVKNDEIYDSRDSVQSEIEENSLNKSKDYVNRKEIKF